MSRTRSRSAGARCWPTAAKPLKVLELACGSANDYRFFDSYGLARFLDYTGIDLNQNNIDNARKRFPGARFEQRSILDLPYDSATFDYVIAFDIFEHLSLQAMDRALAEAVRVAREGFLVAFFIMVDRPEHTEVPKGYYHLNELSAPRIRAAMEKHFSSVDLIRLKTFLAEQYGYEHYGNGRAWSMFADGRYRLVESSGHASRTELAERSRGASGSQSPA
jgi:ubiquinone/menaquinone biosynthesis C-methylase UbiE